MPFSQHSDDHAVRILPFEILGGFLKDFNYENSTEKKTFRHHGCKREDIVLVKLFQKLKACV